MLSCIADNTKVEFQISKQIIVTGGLVVTVCRKPESLTVCWANVDLWSGLQYWIYDSACVGLALGPPHIDGHHITSEIAKPFVNPTEVINC